MSEWRDVRLADVGDIRPSNVDKISIRGERPIRLCNYLDVYTRDYITEDIPFMEATASDAEIRRFGVERGDVLLTKDSETPDDIGVPAVMLHEVADLVAGYHLALVKAKRDVIDPVYLAKQLASDATSRYFGRRANGSTRYGLTYDSLAHAPIRLAPLKQQGRIADILMVADRAIENTEALIAKTQQIKAGLMHHLFTRGVLPDGAPRPKREDSPDLYKRSALGWIPKDWTEGGIEKYLDRSNGLKPGPFGSALTKAAYADSGYRVYGQEQVLAGTLSEGAYYVPLSKWLQLNSFAVAAGDLLMTLVGVGTIGRILIVREPFEPGLINPRIVRMRPDKALCSPEFLGHMVSSPLVRSQFNRLATGGTMPVLNLSIIRRVRVPIVPLVEQHHISLRLQACVARLEQETLATRKLRELRRGLMRDLLTGTVRVPVGQKEIAAAGV